MRYRRAPFDVTLGLAAGTGEVCYSGIVEGSWPSWTAEEREALPGLPSNERPWALGYIDADYLRSAVRPSNFKSRYIVMP